NMSYSLLCAAPLATSFSPAPPLFPSRLPSNYDFGNQRQDSGQWSSGMWYASPRDPQGSSHDRVRPKKAWSQDPLVEKKIRRIWAAVLPHIE
ncbi:MAG: hypothetical protein ACK55I_38240, partial [bacterium]